MSRHHCRNEAAARTDLQSGEPLASIDQAPAENCRNHGHSRSPTTHPSLRRPDQAAMLCEGSIHRRMGLPKEATEGIGPFRAWWRPADQSQLPANLCGRPHCRHLPRGCMVRVLRSQCPRTNHPRTPNRRAHRQGTPDCPQGSGRDGQPIDQCLG